MKLKKYAGRLMPLFIAALLIGGCGDMSSSEKAEILDKAEKVAVEHMKEEYGIDTEITSKEMLPGYVASQVNMKGNVTGHEEQQFNISVNYKEWTTLNTFLNPELIESLRSQGKDPLVSQ